MYIPIVRARNPESTRSVLGYLSLIVKINFDLSTNNFQVHETS